LTASLQDADLRLGPPVVETTGYNTVPLQGTWNPEGHSRQAKRFIRLTLGAGPHALHGELSMTAPQSSGTEAIRADLRQDATHPKKDPIWRMGARAKHVIAYLDG